jgi:hypothetical protein
VIEQRGNIREHIDYRRFGRKMKQALRRVLVGESYRAAAAAEGIDHADLWRAAGSIPGMCEEHLRAWRASWGDEFPPVWEHFLDRPEVRRAAAATPNQQH